MVVKLYMSSVSGSGAVKHQQQKIEMILSSKKIEFEKIDISASNEAKEEMRAVAQDPKCLPPQLANGDQYLGDFSMFDEAVEDERLEEFLKL